MKACIAESLLILDDFSIFCRITGGQKLSNSSEFQGVSLYDMGW